MNPVDGTRQVLSFQRLADYDAYVIVGLNSDAIFEPYRLYARQYELFEGGTTLLILLAGCLLLRSTRRLLISREVLRDAVDAISQGIVMVDARGRVPVINRRAGELLGIPHGVTEGAHAVGASDIALLRSENGHASRPYQQVRADGTVLEIDTHTLDTGGVVRTYTNITERKRAEAQILHLAMHDGLTGLPNRRLLADRLGEAVARRTRAGQVGHCSSWILTGSRISTTRAATHLATACCWTWQAGSTALGVSVDMAARIGGDEFCILQTVLGKPVAPEALAGEVVRLLSKPYQIDSQEDSAERQRWHRALSCRRILR